MVKRAAPLSGATLATNTSMTLLAQDLMQKAVVTVAADLQFPQIRHLFVVARIGGAPVVDASGAVVGVISTTDLLGAIDQALDEDVDPGADDLESLTALDLATPEVIWVSPTSTITEVAEVMRARGVHRVLVGTDGRLAGILTAFDLLQGLTRVMPGA